MSLLISFLTGHLNFELKIWPQIRPDIRYSPTPDIQYPAFRLARYPPKSISDASLLGIP
jgi:hypothetical protein